MDKDVTRSGRPAKGIPISSDQVPRIPIFAFGMSLGLFLSITFTLCVAFDLVFPGMAMYQTWLKFLPGFTWLSFPNFILGLIESFAYGWYVALIFGPLFNFFSMRWNR